MKTSHRSRASGTCARPVSPACVPTRTEPLPHRSTFPVCAGALQPSATQLSFPLCPVTLSAMAKKSKKAPEEEAPKKGKKKAAAKK